MAQSLVLVTPQIVEASQQQSIARSVAVPAKIDSGNEVTELIQKQKNLQTALDDFAAAQNGTYGIYVRSLGNGILASHNIDTQLSSASLYKLFAAQLAYQRVDSGEWSLSQPMTDGDNLEQCLEKMITVSDNPCGIAILNRIGQGNINTAVMSSLGYPSTDLSGTFTKSSAEDVARLLSDLYNGKILSESSGQSFLDLLAAQKINDRLPQGLPDGVQIAHKTGDLAGYVHDAGIVRSVDGDYIIVVMSGPDSTIPNYAQRYVDIAELSASVFSALFN